LKLLNALVLAFFPFAAAAQTFDTSTIPSGCRDNHFLPMQGSMPVQIIQPTHDERGAAMLDPNPLASTGSEKGERAVQSTQENQSVKSSTTSEDELTVNGPIEQGSIPAQTEQALSEERGAAMLDPDRIASTGTEKGDRAVQSTTSEDDLTVNGPIEQGSIPAQTGQALSEERGAAMLDPDRIASTGTEKGDRAVQSTQENQSVKSSTTSEDELTVNGPIEQGSIPAQTGQAISEEGGAAGSEKADRIPAGAVQAADEPQTVKSSTSSYEP
jgi:hypothetical protein